MSRVGVASHLALGLLLGLLVTACVRLDTPDSFTCSSNLDCTADEHCSSQGVCKPKGTCSGVDECARDQSCQNGKCVPAQCDAGREAACGGYICNTYERSCYDSCYRNDGNCSAGYRCSSAGACEPGLNLANGKPCSNEVDCASRICCGPANTMSRVCAATCKTEGDACNTAADCNSGRCCANEGGRRRCQEACDPLAAGSTCALPEDCLSGYCVSGVCAKSSCRVDGDCGKGFCDQGSCETEQRDLGGACLTAAWCKSGSCASGVCRGKAGGGATCGSDHDCEAGRVCCASPYNASFKCSALSQGCDGANGDSCSLGGAGACLSGMCLSVAMCTQACAADADCGISPWGSKNYCKKNGVGNFICFPGCSSEKECNDNVDDFFSCTSGVCAGGLYSADPLQLW